ncbi:MULTISPECIES: right-handed parallel beta-helix repeat-containing protein [Rossellomorea]|uniref:right-handed parallel beta-helix repeat-containing protein n=1 Tax=Rossellomorea TaxID=2837508 RepID=UPI00165342BE|nr:MULTISPECIES: NosD domain-containing protein [Rossellomorea]
MNRKKYIGISALSLLFILFLTKPDSATSEGQLQALIDQASAGSAVTLLDHTYEDEIIITKPITLIGSEYTVIRSCSNQPLLQVQADDVKLQNIQLEHCKDDDSTIGPQAQSGAGHEHDNHEQEETEIGGPSIYLAGSNITLDNIQINSRSTGIRLDGVTNSVIKGGKITTNGAGHAIDVWDSTENVIQGVEINHVLDGIYMERGSKNKILQNNIQSARYGLHLMYSDEVVVQSNLSHQNFTGAMVMTTNNAQVIDNTFSFNNSNVHSQGLLLFDADDTIVRNNTITQNRVGIFMESAEGNEVMDNLITSNFIGVQFNKTNQNTVTNNSFIGNVNELQAVDSIKNNVDHNYWDASMKLQQGNEGTSIFPYAAEPLYLLLTEDTPAYQLFFDSPGITVLKALFKVPAENVMQDENPLMTPPVQPDGDGFNLLPFILKVFIGLGFTIIGIKLFNTRRKYK